MPSVKTEEAIVAQVTGRIAWRRVRTIMVRIDIFWQYFGAMPPDCTIANHSHPNFFI
jgi:hypothetical protein